MKGVRAERQSWDVLVGPGSTLEGYAGGRWVTQGAGAAGSAAPLSSIQDLPSFTQNVHRLVNDLRYYRLCNDSLPPGTVKL